MNDFKEHIANLSPEARALFEAKLRRKTATRQRGVAPTTSPMSCIYEVRLTSPR